MSGERAVCKNCDAVIVRRTTTEAWRHFVGGEYACRASSVAEPKENNS